MQIFTSYEFYADPMMLSTVFRNLLSNAVKFTLPGGRITISSEQVDTKMSRISVSDTGVGIPPQDQEKLFKIDDHLSTEGTAGEPGTGLGLILCKDLVERNQGEIDFETGEWGSTFRFTVPLVNDEESSGR
jgi:two-component system, sensor histidine kinase and response regulator